MVVYIDPDHDSMCRIIHRNPARLNSDFPDGYCAAIKRYLDVIEAAIAKEEDKQNDNPVHPE